MEIDRFAKAAAQLAVFAALCCPVSASAETIGMQGYQPAPVRSIHIAASNTAGLSHIFSKDGPLQLLSKVQISAQDDIAATIENYYKTSQVRMIWINGDEPSALATQAMAVLGRSAEYGLNPGDYAIDTSFRAERNGTAARDLALAAFEISLTSKFLTFLEDNYRGRIDPNKVSDYYDFHRKPIDLGKILKTVSASTDLESVVRSLTPGGSKFLQLASELRWLKSTTLTAEVSKNIDRVTVAMEQLRWLPDDLGERYVFINQPAFMAYYHNNGQVELSMKTVIGQAAHQTNFFQGTIKTVEFNPSWLVPPSIIQNEMLPKLRKDASYLDKAGYTVKVSGKPVRSADVNWNTLLDNVEVAQPPGPDNALGRLKILFPNTHAIYMHDTPAKNKFAMDERMFSHGCVRLSDPRRMAAAVLNVSVEEVDTAIAQGETQDRAVPEPIPVYVTYFTAWPNTDGSVHYYDDVYGRNALTLAAMAGTSRSRNVTVEAAKL